jgi:hypothetical protein
MRKSAIPETEAVHTVSRVDVAKALKLRLQGLTFTAIGKVLGVTKQSVSRALTNFEPFLNGVEPGQLTAYAEERGNFLSAIEVRLMRSLTDEGAIKKASLRDRTVSMGIVFDKRRLEAGQSTNNVSVLSKLILQAEEKLGVPAKATKETDST